MRSDFEGSYEELEKELLEYLAMIDIGRQLGTSTPRQTVRITTKSESAEKEKSTGGN